MAIFMLTAYMPFHKTAEVIKLMPRVGKFPDYIKKWQQLTAADGKNGFKTYNIIYIDDAHVVEAVQYITRVQLLFAEIEGYSWIIEPVGSQRDSQKIMAIKLGNPLKGE